MVSPFNAQVIEELTSLGKIAGPILIISLLLHSKSIISMLFLGYLGDIELAGGSLALGFANITGYSIIKGLAKGMEPICSQAYGARRWSVLTQTYQKTVVLLVLATIPISLLWLNMEKILLWLSQNPNITSVASVYITYSLPDLFAQAHLHPITIFLRAQNLTTPLTITSLGALVLHLPINYFLVIYLKLGVTGVALASAWNTVNLNIGLLGYLALSETALKPWKTPMSFLYFRGWQPLLALAVPSALSVCLEWWWYEVMVLFCGLLSNPEANLAAMGILIQTTGLIYVFPSSLNLGLSMRVGHQLGADQPTRAQLTTLIGLAIAVICGFTALLLSFCVKNVLGTIFTSDTQTLALVSIALPILGFCELGNCPQTAACGVLTGSARPKAGANINFISFYLIGLPVAIILGFGFDTGFKGLWLGLVAAQFSCLCMMVFALVCTDWKHQVKRAQDLTQESDIETRVDLEESLLC
ncbi:hypothetical protein MKW98_009696 [Papaver atlanticum]|uniref:Protein DETOXIFICATION n=1 Tax=Papaver atlanticum TaxID=357466 RepID=A0AAD4SV44_9MAGN|nr:hypothetical protein MKW98_009696 [Papaver atlanticum]